MLPLHPAAARMERLLCSDPAVPWRQSASRAARIAFQDLSILRFLPYKLLGYIATPHNGRETIAKAYRPTFDVHILRGVSLTLLHVSHLLVPAMGSIMRAWPIDFADRRVASDHAVPDSAVAAFAQPAYVNLVKLDGTTLM
jgi:hypothetical protein